MTTARPGVEAIQPNLELVDRIVRGVQRHGFTVGRPEPLPDPLPSPPLPVVGAPRAAGAGATTPGGAVRRSLAVLWLASGVSAVTGVLVAALLTGWPFMLAINTFLGVKVAHVIPPVLVGFLLAFGGGAGAMWPPPRPISH